MTNESRFQIIFVKLAEALAEPAPSEAKPRDTSPEEIDEIDQLRRLALEISDPEPMSYTTT